MSNLEQGVAQDAHETGASDAGMRDALWTLARWSSSVMLKAAGFYVMSLAFIAIPYAIGEAVTGYTIPDNPLESDYPEPAMFTFIFWFGYYVLWVLTVGVYKLAKRDNNKGGQQTDSSRPMANR